MSWDILGHEWAADLLQKHIIQNKHRHAYLFTGPAGVGRRTLALRFIQALNCTSPAAPGVPCRACRTCRQIEAMQHPDLSILQVQADSNELKVEQVRELQHSLALAPYTAPYRVALLLQFEKASDSAANALLKTLEEPPGRVVILLTAENAENLKPTIVSRCEILRLRPMPVNQLIGPLETQWGWEPEQARVLAHLSGGRPGRAFQLHHNQDELEARQSWLKIHYALLTTDRTGRFAFAEKETKSAYKDAPRVRRQLRSFLEIWLALWRDILLTTTHAEAPLVNIDQENQIERLAQNLSFSEAYRSIAALIKALERLEKYVNMRLLLEVLLLDLPFLSPEIILPEPDQT